MSYILDALQKADSERKLGSVPSIYASPPETTARPPSTSPRSWLPWVLAFNALLIVAALGIWLHVRSSSNAAPAAMPLPPVPAPATVAPEPHVALRTHDSGNRNLPEEGPKTEQAQYAAPAALPQIAPKTARKPAPVQHESSPTTDDKAVSTLHDLPDRIQREIPATTVSGYIYAKIPADRSVLINNKLLHEGEEVEPGLILEKMTPSGLVMSFKGYRYRLPY
jgi:general secretion pathway protein B